MAKTASASIRATGMVFVLTHALHLVAHRQHRAAIARRGKHLIGLSADLRGHLVNARARHGDRKVDLKAKEVADLDNAAMAYAEQVKAIKAGANAALDHNDSQFAASKAAYHSAITTASGELVAVHRVLNTLDGVANL